MLINKSIIIPYSVTQMFAIVEDIHRYPEFLSWCSTVEILELDKAPKAVDYRRTARIHIKLLGQTTQFTTINHCLPCSSLNLDAQISVSSAPAKLAEKDPFKLIEGAWVFSSLGEIGSKIAVNMNYEFRNPLIEKLFGRLFATLIDGFADAFVHRAQVLYGVQKKID